MFQGLEQINIHQRTIHQMLVMAKLWVDF